MCNTYIPYFACIVETKEYCQGDSFEAECHDGEVILMEKAKYGRMRTGRCTTDTYDLNCEEDVLSFFDQRCSGRKRCSVYVAGQMLYKMNPCSKELAPYLEAAYTCVKGRNHLPYTYYEKITSVYSWFML